MKKVLLVDDDPVVGQLYEESLSRTGMAVEVVPDGVAAIHSLHTAVPDVMVLDLMMPKLSGIDVLKYIRSQASLAGLPCIVLSNYYLGNLAEEAVTLGARKGLPKAHCTPALLVEAIQEVLGASPATPGVARDTAAGAGQLPPSSAHNEFFAAAPETRAGLQKAFEAYLQAPTREEREQRIEDLYLKVHALSSAAGLAKAHLVTQMATVFEAMLYQVMHKPELLTPSVQHTIEMAVDFVGSLLGHSAETLPLRPPLARVLVVDDDPLTNRVVVGALKMAQLQPASTESPLVALDWAAKSRYDLFLLDVQMPFMDGFELCKRLRALPGYNDVPMVFVTSHSGFESCARSILSGGNDVISKPVMPLELAVKAVMHLLERRLEPDQPASPSS